MKLNILIYTLAMFYLFIFIKVKLLENFKKHIVLFVYLLTFGLQ